MSLEVRCPNCQAKYVVGARSTRTEYACVKCQTMIPIPRPAAAPSQEPASASPSLDPLRAAGSEPSIPSALGLPAPQDAEDEYALSEPVPEVAMEVADVGTRRKKRKVERQYIDEDDEDDDERPGTRRQPGFTDWLDEIPIPMWICYGASSFLYALALLNWFLLKDIDNPSMKGGAILRALIGSFVMIGLFTRMGIARRAEVALALLGGGAAVCMILMNPIPDPDVRVVFNVVLGVQLCLWMVEAACLVLPSTREFFEDD